MHQIDHFQVEELWESMCSAAINLTARALNDVSNAEVLLKIKGFIALFVQTMEVGVVPKKMKPERLPNGCLGMGLPCNNP